jgi:hypothetical protein
MPPKQVKKQAVDDMSKYPDIQTIQKEWADNAKEIITIREKLASLEKHNDELVSKLWELMNKSPTNTVVIEGDETPVVKPIKKKVEPAENNVDEKPVVKPTKKKVEKTVNNSDNEEPIEKPKLTKKKQVEKPVDKPEIEKPVSKVVKKAAPKEETKPVVKGKIAAPSKGTPKQKVEIKENENDNPTIQDTSSDDTDIDSLSSVSDESDVSGGEDN